MSENYIISPDVSSRRVGEEMFVLNRNDSVVFNLNVTGAIVWDGIHTGKTTDQIVREVYGLFDVDAEAARRDVVEIIAALAEKQLVRAVD